MRHAEDIEQNEKRLNTKDLAKKAKLEARAHCSNLSQKLITAYLDKPDSSQYATQVESLFALIRNPHMDTKNKDLEGLKNLLHDPYLKAIATHEIQTYPYLYFPSLSKDILKTSLKPYLPAEAQAALGVSHPRLFAFFRPAVNHCVKELLRVVAGSETELTIEILKKNADLLLLKSSLIDSAGRVFNSISPLQYAQWVGDWPMKDLLLSYFPKDRISLAKNQLNEVKENGVEYEFYLDLEDPEGEITFEAIQKADAEKNEQSGIFLDARTDMLIPKKNVKYQIKLPAEDYNYQENPVEDGKTRVLVKVKGERNFDYAPLGNLVRGVPENVSGLQVNLVFEKVNFFATSFLKKYWNSNTNVKFTHKDFLMRFLEIGEGLLMKGLTHFGHLHLPRDEAARAKRLVDFDLAVHMLIQVSSEKLANVEEKYFSTETSFRWFLG